MKDLNAEDLEHLRSAIEDHYYFELVLGMLLLMCYSLRPCCKFQTIL